MHPLTLNAVFSCFLDSLSSCNDPISFSQLMDNEIGTISMIDCFVNVKDQRVSFLLVSVLLGVSVALAPLLKNVPFAVLFGVFLYMGVSGINGIQLFDRIALVLQPVKHHPSVSYVRRVCIYYLQVFDAYRYTSIDFVF